MKNITVGQIVEACNGKYVGPAENLKKNITGVVIDNRNAEPGSIFVAIKGERNDGHDFAKKAIEAGAICCISEKELSEDVPYILVESSAKALQDAAKYYRSILQVKIIGITGSVGKTSTKETISAVVSQKYKTHKTQGNYNNELGLPLTIFQVEDYHEVVVLEMGISDFGEMHLLADIARPDICVITNIGLCHLETLKSREGILKAKSEIFDFINEDAGIIVNKDDDMLATLECIKGIKPITFSLENQDATAVASEIVSEGLEGTDCTITYGGDTVQFKIPVPGNHMVYNACAAFLAGKYLGITNEEFVKGIATLLPVNGRTNVIKGEHYTVIDDCYNANPVSMKAAVDVLENALGRKVAILGDMFELGENEVELHASVGEYVWNKDVDLVICVGKLSKAIAEKAKEKFSGEVIHFETREELLENVFELIHRGDNILVKASHGMGFDKVVEVLTK